MNRNTLAIGMASLLLFAGACTQKQAFPDVQSKLKNDLDAAGLRDVKTSQDKDRGVVTLSGQVQTTDDKDRAQQIAKSDAQGQIVANEVAVQPNGMESEAKGAQSALDKGIEDDLKAALISNQLNSGVDYSAKQGVLTLTGKVDTERQRDRVQQLAMKVPNVKQVVNELDVKGQQASTKTGTQGLRNREAAPPANRSVAPAQNPSSAGETVR